MDIIYKAYDGTIFNTVEECLEYESILERKIEQLYNSTDIIFFDDEGNKMRGTIGDLVCECAFIAVINRKGLLYLKAIERNYLVPEGIGLWEFDDYYGCWFKIKNADNLPKSLQEYV